MQKDSFDRILSFLLGASWAILFFGALILFRTLFPLGLALAIISTIFFIFIVLVFILLLDAFAINRQRLAEAKKQTEILQKIYSKHTK
jgi:uncharacterized membrane protein